MKIALNYDCFHHSTGQSANFLFILGCGRSGNTLLRRLIMERCDIYIPPETYVLPRQVNQYVMSGHLNWCEKVDVILILLENHPEFETFGVDSLKEFQEVAKGWSVADRSFLNLIIGLYKWLALRNSSSCAWVGDKTPLNTFSLGILNKAFPEAKFIFLERDPVDVIQSYLKSGIYKNALDAAKRWRKSLIHWQRFKKIKNKDDLIEIRYEKLVSDSDAVLDEIENRFSLPKRDEIKIFDSSSLGDVGLRFHHCNVQNAPSTTSIGKGRATISAENLKVIRSVLGNLPQERGYQKI